MWLLMMEEGLWMQRGGRTRGNLPPVASAMSAWSECCVAA